MENFLSLIFEPLQELLLKFKAFLPGLLAMLVILGLGILLARIFKLIVLKSLTALKFDNWSDRMGFTALMRKGDLWTKPSAVVGSVLYWLLVIFALMFSLSALKVAAIDHLAEQFFAYMPRAFSAAIILVIGFLLSGFISRAVLIGAVNSGFHYAKLLAEAIRSLLTVLIIAMVMEQLQIAPNIVLAAFSIIFGGIVTALAIAFGVGGIEAAKRMIEREAREKANQEARDEIEHI